MIFSIACVSNVEFLGSQSVERTRSIPAASVYWREIRLILAMLDGESEGVSSECDSSDIEEV